MSHAFQIGEKTYVAEATAYRVLVASKTPCTIWDLPDVPPEPAIDLFLLSTTEKEIVERRQNGEKVGSDTIKPCSEMERLFGNPILAFHALYYLCHDKYDPCERTEFIKSIDNQCCDAAMQALIGAVADFFDSQNLRLTACALRRAADAAKLLSNELAEGLKAITPEMVVNELKRRAGGGSSNSSEPLESTPATPT